jgi:hypothetical protein
MANLAVFANTGSGDIPLNGTSADFTQIDPNNDVLIFSAGSDVVKDGEPIPSQSELIQAGVVLTGSQIIVDKYFLSDLNANLLRETELMGNQDAQYVLAFDFDDLTASEPVLELWDDTNLDTIDNITLGAGTATNSWWRGVATTSGSPGANWAPGGITLAGSSDGHFVFLNNENGALPSATTLYANLAIVIPASAITGGSVNPIFAVKWLSN